MGGAEAGLLSIPPTLGDPCHLVIRSQPPPAAASGCQQSPDHQNRPLRGVELPLRPGVQVCLSVPKAAIYRQQTLQC